MRTRRIHVMGASGAGVTTLGRALADALALPHHDSDDYFWLPTTPPYRQQRDIAERLRLRPSRIAASFSRPGSAMITMGLSRLRTVPAQVAN